MKTPIYIIGAGAIGMILAVLLKQAGKDVILIRGRQESPTEADEATITVDCVDDTTVSSTIPIRSLEAIPALDGPVLLTTKSFGNEVLAQRLSGKTGQSPLILLQNGLTNEEPFLEADFPRLYRCVLLATSQVQAAYVVRYKPVAASLIGIIRGHEVELADLVAKLTTTRFPFRAEVAIQQAIWEKVITNCVFNTICPLLNVDNGIFYRNTSALVLAREVIAECLAVAGGVGVVLNPAEVEQRLLQISQRSDGQLISTLVDINQGRETEIDSLNLAVARLAKRLGQPDLASKTRLLGELTRLKAETSRIS